VLRDKLEARLREMGDAPDHQRLAAEVLGIRNAPAELARRLVQQALVLENRRDVWRRDGERICAQAPALPGVYVLRDRDGRALYVGKAVNLRRRLRAHFADRRWRAIKPEMARAADAEWIVVGSELEALLREAALIHELKPPVNVQIGAPDARARQVPRPLMRDVIVVVPSVEDDSAELIGARADGGWLIQRTRRSGADLAVHARRLLRFFRAPHLALRTPHLAPIVFSWLAGRGAGATRLDPHDIASARRLQARLAAVLKDDRLFLERVEQLC
jgi:predicted GIY-YIG superfamily endonuclease